MILLTNTRHQVIASQVTQQLDPLLVELRTAQDQQKTSKPAIYLPSTSWFEYL